MATIVRLPDLPVVPAVDGDTVAAYRNGNVVRIPAGGGGGDLPDLATVATTGQYSDLLGRPTLGSAASMSASSFATAAQGALADTALQPADIGATIQAYSAILSGTTASFTAALKTKLDGIQAGATENATDSYLLNLANHTGTQGMGTITGLSGALDGKVDKQAGYGLSQENYTPAEKSKLAALESSRWKGEFTSLSALQAALPTSEPGDYANVDAGTGQDVERYIWDSSDNQWVKSVSAPPALTPAQIKAEYESNPDTNAFTDAEKSKLAGVAPGATANTGTVTSVQLSAPTGLSVSGGPVTTSGTLTIAYQSGYSIPANSKQGEWDTAYGWGNHALAGYVTTAAMHAYTYDKETIDSKIDAGGGGGEETYPYRGVLTTEDLNDVRESGVYGQPSTPNATLARNYPDNIAGALEVLVLNAATTPYPIVTQRYTTNEGTQRIFIRRGGAQGGWNAWREIAIGVGTNAYVNQYISTNPPSGTSPGDVWYQVES